MEVIGTVNSSTRRRRSERRKRRRASQSPAKRPKGILVNARGRRLLREHGVGAEIGNRDSASPGTLQRNGEGCSGSPMRTNAPILGKGAKSSSEGLSEEHMVVRSTDSESGVYELKRRRGRRGLEEGGCEELVLDGDGAKTEVRIVELLSGSSLGNGVDTALERAQGKVETREEEAEEEGRLGIRRGHPDETNAVDVVLDGEAEHHPGSREEDAATHKKVTPMRVGKSDLLSELDQRRSGVGANGVRELPEMRRKKGD